MNADELKGCKIAVKFICRALSQEVLKHTHSVLMGTIKDEYDKAIEKMVADEIERRQNIISDVQQSIKVFFEGLENEKQQ